MSKNNNISIEKLSLAECKKILSKKGKVYSDSEIISIRDLLYCLAQVDIETYYHAEQNRNNNNKVEKGGEDVKKAA